MNTMKRSMIGLCAAFACVSVANASPDTASSDTTDYTQEAIEAAQSTVNGGVLKGITQSDVDDAQDILNVGSIRTGVTQADINLNKSIVDNTQEMVDIGYITDDTLFAAVKVDAEASYDNDAVYDNDEAMDLVDSLLTAEIVDAIATLDDIVFESDILPIPIDNIPAGLAALVSDAVNAAKFRVDGIAEDFGLDEPIADDYVNEDYPFPGALDVETTGDVNPDFTEDTKEFTASLASEQAAAEADAEAANKAVVDAILAANAVEGSIAAPQAIIDVGVLSTITEEDIVEAWETTVLGVRVETTQEQVDTAQDIVDAGLTIENTSFSFSKKTVVSRELYEYAKTVVRYTEQSLFKKSRYNSSDIVTAEAIVAAGVIEAITEDQYNSATTYVEMADQPSQAIPSVIESKALLKKGITTGVTQANLNVAQSVVDAQKTIDDVDALGNNATSRSPVTQAEVNENIELLSLLTYAAEHFGSTSGVLGSTFEFEDSEIDLETMQAIIELAEAQILVERGVMAGTTQEDIDVAQAILDASMTEAVTQSIFDEAQAIVDAGVIEAVTQADIDEAQAIVDAGLVEGVTQVDIDEAQAIVDAGLVEGVTQADIDVAQAKVDAGVEITEQARVMQVLVGSGKTNENPTAEEIENAQAVRDGYETKYGSDVVQDVIDIYTIDGNDEDAFMAITNSSNDEDVANDKKFVSHGGIDAVKALVNTGNVETALSVLFQLDDDETLTVKDFIVKSNPDVSSSASGSIAGVSVVGGAIGGHQQSSVASSGKYGLKKHSLSVSKQLGVSSGGEGRDTGAWMEVFGSASEMDMRDAVSGYNADSSGIVVGVDKTIGNMMIGAAISVADIDVDGKSSADSRTDSDQYQGTLYGTLMMDSFYVNGSVAYAHASNDTSRTGLAGTVTGSYGTDIYAASLGIGIPVDLGNSAIIPQATLSYASISPDAYTESGVGALHVDIEDMKSFGIKAGVAVINTIVLDGGIIAPKLRLMADWDISREKAVVNSSWVGDVDNTIYSTTGARPASLGAVMGAGVDYASDDGLYVLSLDYDLSTRSNFVSHAGSAKLRVNF